MVRWANIGVLRAVVGIWTLQPHDICGLDTWRFQTSSLMEQMGDGEHRWSYLRDISLVPEMPNIDL